MTNFYPSPLSAAACLLFCSGNVFSEGLPYPCPTFALLIPSLPPALHILVRLRIHASQPICTVPEKAVSLQAEYHNLRKHP